MQNLAEVYENKLNYFLKALIIMINLSVFGWTMLKAVKNSNKQ